MAACVFACDSNQTCTRSKGVDLTLDHGSQSFKEKYIDMVENAFSNGKMLPITYAIFTDKYLARKNKFQKFGTQVLSFNGNYTLFPVDLTTLNQNRASINLKENMYEYLLNNYGTEFDSTNYLKILPALIEKYKIKVDSIQ